MESNISIPVTESNEFIRESPVLTALRISSLVVLGFTFVFGILGNGLVIWVAGFQMVRTVTNLCCLNLALADFSFTSALPFVMASTAMNGKWPFGWFPCKLINTMADLNLFGSVFLIAFIALDRCICVLHPVWAQNHRTVSLARKVIIVPWILALLLTLHILIFLTTISDEGGNTYCIINLAAWGDTPTESLKVTISILTATGIIRFVIGFTMPMSIVAICYGLIAAKIRKQGMIDTSRPLRVLTAVVVSFFICWFPLQLVALLSTIWLREIVLEDKYEILNYVVYPVRSLAFFNSCLNPMLYVFVGRDFRKRLIHNLPASLERALTEDSAPTSHTVTKSASPPTEAELQAM